MYVYVSVILHSFKVKSLQYYLIYCTTISWLEYWITAIFFCIVMNSPVIFMLYLILVFVLIIYFSSENSISIKFLSHFLSFIRVYFRKPSNMWCIRWVFCDKNKSTPQHRNAELMWRLTDVGNFLDKDCVISYHISTKQHRFTRCCSWLLWNPSSSEVCIG